MLRRHPSIEGLEAKAPCVPVLEPRTGKPFKLQIRNVMAYHIVRYLKIWEICQPRDCQGPEYSTLPGEPGLLHSLGNSKVLACVHHLISLNHTLVVGQATSLWLT